MRRWFWVALEIVVTLIGGFFLAMLLINLLAGGGK